MVHELTTLFTGRKQILLDEVDSTNKKLWSILQHGMLPEGTAVRADFQVLGKGQGENRWHSESGKNLLLSFIFQPDFLQANEVFTWNKAVALAVTDAVRIFTDRPERVTVKWPNDIYVDDRKVGGLLIENIISGTMLRQSVVGIGINVNQTEFPADLPNPVSLANAFEKTLDTTAVFHELSNALEQRYLQSKRKDYEGIQSVYLQRLYRLNQPALFDIGGKKIKGTITGVSEEGRLQLLHEEGDLRSYDLKEIRFLP